MNYLDLIENALKARSYSYCPYSGFAVGAALLGESGKIYLGCNVENSSFSVTNCAERTAIFKAVSEGERRFTAIAVVGAPKDADTLSSIVPCGVCLQALSEFCDADSKVIMAKSTADYEVKTLSELLPTRFVLED